MTRAEALHERAVQCQPGGVCSSGRIEPFAGHPFFVQRGEGARVWDVDGREFYDLNGSYGTTHLGHGHPRITEAIVQAAELGIVCTYETEYVTALAEKIVKLVPCAEMVRFLCSGTEATQTAVRLARAHTGRDKVVKFEGHFHGFNDYLNYSYPGTPADTLGPAANPNVVPASGGIPAEMLDLVRVLPFNNLEILEETLAGQGDEIAAVIMEPFAHNSGGICPRPGYLQAVRELTAQHGILLIFDEIITGLRKCPGGAQEYFAVTPDLCTLGKALGAGTPISAFAGSREVMSSCSPLGKAEHRGTYNGNLIPVLAANAFLDIVVAPAYRAHLEQIENRFYGGFQEIIDRQGIACQLQYLGARFSVLFGLAKPPTNYREAARRDAHKMLRFVKELRSRGIYIAELARLKVGDVDLKRKSLRVWRLKRRKPGRETLAIDPELAAHLSEFIEWKAAVGEPVGPRAILLRGKRGPLTTRGLQRIWHQCRARAGLPAELSIHSARHTVAVHQLRKTSNLRIVQKQLGHASPATTANMYADVSFEDMQTAVTGLYED